MTSPEAVRAKLGALGNRRKEHGKAEDELREEVREAVAEARLAKLPMQEVADLLDLNRTTLYQVYLDASPAPA